ncbi:MAG TPA: primosomal protein N', partial [Thiopseudomonas sp.]|nr:primosomal protein N' [Thiopseudomonas sp.]
MSELYLRIALPSPLRRLFDYRAPAQIAANAWQPGVRVRVPFGRREMVGVLVETATATEVPSDKLKDALELLDSQPLLPDDIMRLC